MSDLVCSDCGQPAACTGLYKGIKCMPKKECQAVLELCSDGVDDPKCDKHCSHKFEISHCHMIKPKKPFSKMSHDEIHQYVRGILHEHGKETRRKRAAGICIEPECTKPALKDNSVLFFGDDHCKGHAEAAELEQLIDDQEDDKAGKLP